MGKNEIELFLDEKNELIFDILIEGQVSSKPKVRLVCENSEYSLSFSAQENENDVKVIIPSLKETIKPGEYNSKLEVIVDGKYFTPMDLKMIFKERISIKSESVSLNKKEENKEVSVKSSIKKNPDGVAKQKIEEVKQVKVRPPEQPAKKAPANKNEINESLKKINKEELRHLIQKILKN